MRSLIVGFLVACVFFASAGCQALGVHSGTDPSAQAPAYGAVGVLVLGAGNDLQRAVSGVRMDQSGSTGANGSSTATAEQSQTTEIGQEAVTALLDAAQAALTGGSPEAAKGILGVAQKIAGAKKPPPAAAAPSKPPAAPAQAPPVAPGEQHSP